jgi:glycosyltransferase involved in cell wall biosynthesis
MKKATFPIDVSIVIPAFNEADTLGSMVEAIGQTFSGLSLRYEIVFVDDGSHDGSWQEMSRLAAQDAHVVCGRLRRNFGKATALMTGIGLARGEIIITMDADLQDDPKEIPRFLEKLNEGYDLVSGWKERRQDPPSKTLPSRLFNWVTAKVSGVPLRDFNCGFKAYRSEVFRDIKLYGELHRYIPVLAHSLGYKVAEIAVEHHPRRFGKSKYGLERYARGLLDLLTIVTLTRFAGRPGHLFGGVGLALGVVSFFVISYLVGVWMFTDETIGKRPLLQFGIMAGVISVQLICFGMLAELLVARGQTILPERLLAEVARQEPDNGTGAGESNKSA